MNVDVKVAAATDTIFALASASGKAGLAVVRVSGPGARAALESLTDRPVPEARRLVVRRLADPASGEAIDRSMVAWFPGPRSFTGEDVAEFHVHGGNAVVAGLSAALDRLGVRLAEPGEFSRRGFQNGQFDLAELEGLADLVEAETEMQRRMALRQMDGHLSLQCEQWRSRLISAQAWVEAAIDFSDEELPVDLTERSQAEVGQIERDLDAFLARRHAGERLRDGIQVAIVGPPNAGKSSLINVLARRDVAIVAPTGGTTRDLIEAHLDLAGWPVTVIDTAGLRHSRDPIETEGMRRAVARAQDAHLRIFVFDVRDSLAIPPGLSAPGPADLCVLNKMDLTQPAREMAAESEALGLGFASVVRTSVVNGSGIDTLLDQVAEHARRLAMPVEASFISRQRHRQALQACQDALRRFLGRRNDDPALAAEDLRMAARHLGRITGCVDVEDVLDKIFSEFCIGK